jgi:DNA-binding NarL/FixJ family response regulator
MSTAIDLSGLTACERNVLALHLQGLSGTSIARQMGRCPSTVSAQKKSGLRKLKVGSILELVLSHPDISTRLESP